jgi:hypothetical protein
MTQYLITFSKVNDRLETETWFDQRPSHREVPELLVKAERIEAEAKRRVDEAYDRAERTGENVWDLLMAISPGHGITIGWLRDLRAYYNGERGAECDCVLPEQSCRYCKAMAAVTNYVFEEEI